MSAPSSPTGYPSLALYIAGEFCDGSADRWLDVINPATEEPLGRLPVAEPADLDRALQAVAEAYGHWRLASPLDRAAVLRKAAAYLSDNRERIARVITLEVGKPLAESLGEVGLATDVFLWYAEEARRLYGRIIPSRAPYVRQTVTREPIGPVAAFTPWNFPINQAARKIAAALAAGCPIILKGPEEAPGSCVELARAVHEAGAPAGTCNVVFGVPSEISTHLIDSEVIRKVSFTGSTKVGAELAAMAARSHKRATMELGGHAPVIVAADADLDGASKSLIAGKFRNAGQSCISPTRFLVEEPAFEQFVEMFAERAGALVVGNGLEEGVQMGSLSNSRRLEAMSRLCEDAVQNGSKVVTGGERLFNQGYFWAPTVITDVGQDAALMNEEPFGPVAVVNPVRSIDEAIAEANRLPYGLASYAFSRSARTIAEISARIESGMLSVNHLGLALPETPFGGVKASGHGFEGGTEGLDAYVQSKFISELAI